MSNERVYKTFIRSCNNFKEFAKARKITDSTNLTYEEARSRCDWYNSNLTKRQIAKGTKMEFTRE